MVLRFVCKVRINLHFEIFWWAVSGWMLGKDRYFSWKMLGCKNLVLHSMVLVWGLFGAGGVSVRIFDVHKSMGRFSYPCDLLGSGPQVVLRFVMLGYRLPVPQLVPLVSELFDTERGSRRNSQIQDQEIEGRGHFSIPFPKSNDQFNWIGSRVIRREWLRAHGI